MRRSYTEADRLSLARIKKPLAYRNSFRIPSQQINLRTLERGGRPDAPFPFNLFSRPIVGNINDSRAKICLCTGSGS